MCMVMCLQLLCTIRTFLGEKNQFKFGSYVPLTKQQLQRGCSSIWCSFQFKNKDLRTV